MSSLPFHEISRPMMAAFEWQIAIEAGGLTSTDNSGSNITNPDTQLVTGTRNVLKINKRGTFMQFRVSYDDGLSSITDMVIQVFGRFDKDEPWQRLKNLNDSVDVTVVTASADVEDGTLKYTDPDAQDQTVDLNATDEVIVRVKTALAATGDPSTAVLHAKVIGGVRTY